MKILRNSRERGEAKLMVIAIIMGIAILYSAGCIVASWMHDVMIDRAEKSEKIFRQHSKRTNRKPEDDRPIRGQTLKF